MLAQITGTVLKIVNTSVIISSGPFALEVDLPSKDIEQINEGSNLSVWSYLDVAENHLRLFGFLHFNEREMFKLLISVSGVGPKIGLAVLSQASVAEIKNAVEESDPDLFKSISGIGTKNANRLILELQNKLDNVTLGSSTKSNQSSSETQTIYEALTSLGYRKNEVQKELDKLEKNLTVEEKIQAILKALGR